MNGCRLVEAKYTWQAIGVEMRRAYMWLLKNGQMPECFRVDRGPRWMNLKSLSSTSGNNKKSQTPCSNKLM